MQQKQGNRKPSKYRINLFVGAAAVLMIVLGFVIPAWQWLIFVGAVLFFAAAFSMRVWFVEGWIPTMFANKGPGHNDSLEAHFEAQLRGLVAELNKIPREDSLVEDALSYCDVRTGTTGQH